MPQTKQTLIKIDNLSYEIDGVKILRNINIEIKDIIGRGQIIALVGPSGMGKTTLFNLLSGFLEPTEGKILAHLKEEGMQEVHSHIMGVVRQDYPLFDHRTVLSNLMMVCKDGEATGKCHQLLKDFDLEAVLDKFPSQLSGGQRQRVAIIQQILCSEKYILMDEPFSGLDMIAKCSVCKRIRDIAAQDEENTIILVTHEIKDALKVADTIWMLGVEKDANGGAIPGATIMKNISLIDEGMDLTCCPMKQPKYYEIMKRIETDFLKLKP